MTLQEFKAWFDGFTENIGDKAPSQKQWKRIRARVAEIDGVVVTERVFVDRYWGPYYGGTAWWGYYQGGQTIPNQWPTITCNTIGISTVGTNTVGSNVVNLNAQEYQFSPTAAMYAVGCEDAKMLAAS